MIYLIKGAEVYGPGPMGKCDILISGSEICRIDKDIAIEGNDVTVIGAEGHVAVPGFVDSLVHFSGGGGEGGFHTRTPEMHLTEATLSGVTTVIGALGTDATTRSHADLIAKARGLENEGLSTFCYTGSYQVPARTLTGSVMDDIVLIDKFIGIGELAIADHRSSQPQPSELARIASDARVAGMLAGKGGIVSIHVGDSPQHLALLHQACEQSCIPASQFYPTHMNRNLSLLDAGVAWTKTGGVIDFTTSTNAQFIAEGEIPAAEAVAYCLKNGVDISRLTMSSDGNASLPVFDTHGALMGLEVGKVSSLYDSFKALVTLHQIGIEKAVSTITSSPADILGLKQKGRLSAGKDADIVLLNKQTLAIESVIAKGKIMVSAGAPVNHGTFEHPAKGGPD